MQDYKFPVYATQGGGLVRFVRDRPIFITKPDCPGLNIGDRVPRDWDMAPANDLAQKELEEIHDELAPYI